MRFLEILKRCKGQSVVINNGEERLLIDVEDDFVILQGGNPQMRITEFVPISQLVKVIKADYTATNTNSISLDINLSGGDQRRGGSG